MTAVRNVGANVVDHIVAARREKGRFTDFNDFMARSRCRPAASGSGSLVKAGAFDDSKRRRRARRGPRDGRRPVRRHQEERGDRPGLLFGGLDDLDSGGSFGVTVNLPDIDEWDKATLLAHGATCSGSTSSDHPLLGLEGTCWPRAPTAPSTCCSFERAPTAAPSSCAAWSPRCSAKCQEGRPVGDGHPRGPRRRHRRAVLPQRLPGGLDPPRPGRHHHRQGPGLAQQDGRACTARRSRSPTSATVRRVRWSSRYRPPGVLVPWSGCCVTCSPRTRA